VNARNQRGVLYSKHNQWDKAIQDFDEVIKLIPSPLEKRLK
jgi:hypothetical protein